LPFCIEPEDDGLAGALVCMPVAANASDEQPTAAARRIERGRDRFSGVYSWGG
jgi:hypothetical protein